MVFIYMPPIMITYLP